ncbi:hypothetical protein CFSAN002367_19845 [Clostridium botulinum CFSAN002367]|nr:hypothetical protein CFSAN002367_19845 [Clostridium botulinum CFSAN002367]
MGSIIAKTNKIWKIVISGLILGFIISIAEPDLHILAGQVDFVTTGLISKLSIVIVVSIGIGIMLSLGLARIVRGTPLKNVNNFVLFYLYTCNIYVKRVFSNIF